MKRTAGISTQLKKVIVEYKKTNNKNEKSSLEKADDLYHKLLSNGTIKKRGYNIMDNEEAFIFSNKFNGHI